MSTRGSHRGAPGACCPPPREAGECPEIRLAEEERALGGVWSRAQPPRNEPTWPTLASRGRGLDTDPRFVSEVAVLICHRV